MTLKKQVEALLFSSGRAMEVEQLTTLTGAEKKEIEKALEELYKEYEERDTALKIFQEGSQWKMIIHEEQVAMVRKIVADTELERPVLETLAVIAYNYPKILQSKVVETRGSHAYEHIKELEKLGFLNREKEGRSFNIKLTEKFFEYFDVEGAKDIREVFGDVKIPEKKLGSLEVVQINETEDQKRLGQLSIVDEPPGKPVERNPEEENEFFEKFDEKLQSVSMKNDELEQDPMFQRKEEEIAAGEAEEQEEDPPESDDSIVKS